MKENKVGRTEEERKKEWMNKLREIWRKGKKEWKEDNRKYEGKKTKRKERTNEWTKGNEKKTCATVQHILYKEAPNGVWYDSTMIVAY